MTSRQLVLLGALLVAILLLAMAPFDVRYHSQIADAVTGRSSEVHTRIAGMLWSAPQPQSVQQAMIARGEGGNPAVSDVEVAWGALVGRLAAVVLITAGALVVLPRSRDT